MAVKPKLDKMQRVSKGLLQDVATLESVTAATSDSILQGLKDIHSIIRRELGMSYRRSGLGVRSRRLYSAAVDNAVITLKGRQLVITLGPGYPKQVYVYSGAHQYGATRQSGTKLGASARKVAKATGKSEIDIGSTKITVIPPHRFYQLSADQLTRIQAAWVKAIQRRLNGKTRRATA